jgi:hypothetical protein
MSNLWWLILNITISILACTAIHISNVTNRWQLPVEQHLVAAAQQWRRQHSDQTVCHRAGGQAVGYEHALLTPLFRSEHGGSPYEAAEDAGPGARM